MKGQKSWPPLLVAVILMAAAACGGADGGADAGIEQPVPPPAPVQAGGGEVGNGLKVTFIELGSVNCVPCRMMVPVMEKIGKEYGDQVNIVFYDVWTEEGRPFAAEYRIRVIPTQVFLDAEGKEYFRHEGFFPFEQAVQVLKQKGVH